MLDVRQETTRPLILAARLGLALAIILGLAACKTVSDRAAELVARGLARPVAERAATRSDLREAIALDPTNDAALRALASFEVVEGRIDVAKQMFGRLSAKAPTDADLNLSLADIALYEQDIPSAVHYLDAAAAVASDDPRLSAGRVALAYYQATAAGNAEMRTVRAADAEAMLNDIPALMPALRVSVQQRLGGADPASALPFIDAARAVRPGFFELEMMRLGALTKAGDNDGAVAQMKAMYATFPEDEDIRAWLKEWYESEAPARDAVDFLIDLAARQGDPEDAHAQIVVYVENAMPPEAAVLELDRIAGKVPAGMIADQYRAEAAGLRFNLGDTAAAITTLREVTKQGASLSDRADLRAQLARMLADIGEVAEAEAIVDQVLLSSPYSVPALKMRARWQIERGKEDAAVSTLRTALSDAPADPALLALLAEAYEKTGETDLAGRALSDAMAASNGGVPQTIAVVQFLERTGRHDTAVATLRTARQTHPDDPDLAKLSGLLDAASP